MAKLDWEKAHRRQQAERESLYTPASVTPAQKEFLADLKITEHPVSRGHASALIEHGLQARKRDEQAQTQR